MEILRWIGPPGVGDVVILVGLAMIALHCQLSCRVSRLTREVRRLRDDDESLDKTSD